MADPQLAAEALVAVTGISALLGSKPRPVGVGDAQRAAAIPGRIAREIRGFLSRDKPEPQDDALPQFDYFAVLEELSTDAQTIVDRAQKLLTNIDDPGLAGAYSLALAQVVAYLQQQIPRRVRHGLTADENVEPSNYDMYSFRRVWQIAESPLIVLRDLAEGSLISQQVAALQAMYPTLYANMLKLAFSAVVDKKSARESWEPTWSQHRAIATLFGVDLMSPDLSRDMQAAATAAREAPKGPGIKTTSTALDEAAQGQELPAQRMQAK